MLFIPPISDTSNNYSIERKKIKSGFNNSSSSSSSSSNTNHNAGIMMNSGGGGGALTENIVCIRSTLVIAGYAACIITAAFAIAVVFIPPGPEGDTGLLRYISEGIHQYCGWSIVIMGTTSMILLVCHLVAASHMASSLAFYCALAEAFGWNVILGVVDTGWVIHYIGLFLFLVGSIGYHWIACRDDAYGGFRYQQTNLLAISLTVIFSLVSSASLIVGDGDRRLRACAVSLEFSMLGAFTLQNLVLLNSLDQFKNIHLVFHRANNNNMNNSSNNY